MADPGFGNGFTRESVETNVPQFGPRAKPRDAGDLLQSYTNSGAFWKKAKHYFVTISSHVVLQTQFYTQLTAG